MKSILLISAMLLSLSLFASNVDTFQKPIFDTAFIPKAAIKISPISINLKGDSAYSFTWVVSGINRDTSISVILSISLLDKSGNKIDNLDYTIPAYVINKGINISVIDNFILNRNKMLIRK